MKPIVIFLGIIACVLTGCKTTQDPAKIAEKEAQEAQDKIWYDAAVKSLNDREFVLEADRVNFRGGRFIYVTSNTNFVSMHGDKATIQMAFNSPYAGPNGIGGITVDGTASNIKMDTDSKGNVTFSMMVQGVAVSANVTLRMTNGSNKCTATVSPNFSGNRIDFTGSLYHESESNVFKGRSL
ncbi:MAG: DUF4251 domain-containing protein [Tannerella sp.]|jgi:hypothetical protein|nr:DUF4251 domain-containing protein [Tannerella sp.]